MSGAQSSSLGQFVVEVSRRNRISKNCGHPVEASTVTLPTKSSSTSETLSTAPASTKITILFR